MTQTRIIEYNDRMVIATDIDVNRVKTLKEAINVFVDKLKKYNLEWAIKYTKHTLAEICPGNFITDAFIEDGYEIMFTVEFEEDGTSIILEINKNINI